MSPHKSVSTIAALAVLLAATGCSTLHVPGLGHGDTRADGSAAAPSAAEVATESRKAMLAKARADLVALQGDAALAATVPNEIRDAELAVKTADSSQYDAASGAHLVYIADRKVQLARTKAEARQLSARLEALRAQRDQPGSPAP